MPLGRTAISCNDISAEQQNVKITIDELRQALQDLDRVALLACVMEEEDYYEKLIDVEEAQRTPGWKNRVVALRELKDQAHTFKQVMDNQDAQAVIFQSAMAQLQKDLKDVRDTLGQDMQRRLAQPVQKVQALGSPRWFGAPQARNKKKNGGWKTGFR